MLDTQNGIGAGLLADLAAILRTTDGGQSWQRFGLLLPEGAFGRRPLFDIQSLSFVDARHG